MERHFLPPPEHQDSPTEPPRRSLLSELATLRERGTLCPDDDSPLEHAVRAFAADARTNGVIVGRMLATLEWCLADALRADPPPARELEVVQECAMRWALDEYYR